MNADRVLTLVEKIRRKPEPTRWAIIGAITVITSILLVILWGWNLKHQFNLISVGTSEESFEGRDILGPFSAIWRTWEAVRAGEAVEPIVEEPKESQPNLGQSFGERARKSAAALGEAVRFNMASVGQMFRDLIK